jgi:hypothetical protein
MKRDSLPAAVGDIFQILFDNNRFLSRYVGYAAFE